MELVRDAIMAGVLGDLGSGSNVDLCVITKHSSQLIRPYDSSVSEQHSTSHHRRSAISLTATAHQLSTAAINLLCGRGFQPPGTTRQSRIANFVPGVAWSWTRRNNVVRLILLLWPHYVKYVMLCTSNFVWCLIRYDTIQYIYVHSKADAQKLTLWWSRGLKEVICFLN